MSTTPRRVCLCGCVSAPLAAASFVSCVCVCLWRRRLKAGACLRAFRLSFVLCVCVFKQMKRAVRNLCSQHGISSPNKPQDGDGMLRAGRVEGKGASVQEKQVKEVACLSGP